MVVIGVMVDAFHILHGLIVITAAARRASGDIGNLLLHVKLFTLEQGIHNLSQSDIAGAEPARVSTLMLGPRLQIEEVTLRARREFQRVDATICRGLAGGLVGDEASIGRDHHQVQLGLGVGSAARAPAEVNQFIFGVKVDVAGDRLRLDNVRRLVTNSQ